MDDHLPIIVGVGEALGNRDRDPDAAREPMALILDAVAAAADDTGAGNALLSELDAVAAVRTTSWAYDHAAATVATRVGAAPHHLVDTGVGGHWPVALLEQAAARIAGGEDESALLVGGEAQAALQALYRAGRDPAADAGWSQEPGGPPGFAPDDLGSPRMQASSVVLPIRVYPMFHNAMQAAEGIDPGTAVARSAALYSGFSAVAADHPVAWNRQVRSAEEIATVAPGNRMVCEPYPLALNAMPQVDQAAAVLLTSVGAARRHGIPADRWVHVWGGAGTRDTPDVLERRAYARSDALAHALDTALQRTGVAADQLDLIDVYSCFPVVPELLAAHLGLAETTPLSVTGGHAAFGGPLNSYSLHAVAAVSRQMRAGAGVAMVHANGGYLTHQYVTLLGAGPHPDGYVGGGDRPIELPADAPVVRDAADVVTADTPVPVDIETFTVEHGRDGQPAQAFVIARTAAGERLAAATPAGDRRAAAALSLANLPAGDITHIGRRVAVHATTDGPRIVP